MRISKTLRLVAGLALSLAGPASADVWDVQFDHDDNAGTENELVHGTSQTHDLGVRPGPAADQDWYLIPQKPHASYEVIVDGTSGDIGPFGLALDRIASDGVTVVQAYAPAVLANGFAYSRALRWVHTPGFTTAAFVRVSGAFCGTDCGSDDVYTIRLRETTVHVPRFNNSGSQATVVFVQNATDRPVDAVLYFWGASGGSYLYAFRHPSLPAKAVYVFTSTLVPALAGQSGHITVSHDGGYGGVVVKAVALEPTTGFSFDTPGVYVPD